LKGLGQLKSGLKVREGYMNVVVVQPNSDFLVDVIKLWRANSKTLGPLPEGAFDEEASDGRILAAIDPNERLIGYLSYNVSNLRAKIVHLCIASGSRRTGAARALLTSLEERTPNLRGMYLDCRDSYDLNRFWPQLGFQVVGKRLGRGAKPKELTRWLRDYGHRTLFDYGRLQLQENIQEDIAIDMNVFLDLVEERRDSEEAHALEADWLAGQIRLCVTHELMNEIERDSDAVRKQRRRSLVSGFEQVHGSTGDFEWARDTLRTLFGVPKQEREASDYRHLANAYAADIRYFVTREDSWLKRTDPIQEQLSIKVLRPATLAVEFDRLRNEAKYEPARVAGTMLRWVPLDQSNLEQVVSLFLKQEAGESRSDFRNKITANLGRPDNCDIRLLQEGDRWLGISVLERVEANVVRVPILRVLPGPLAKTLVRFMIEDVKRTSVLYQREITLITEQYLDDKTRDGLIESAFLKLLDGRWAKVSLNIVGTNGGIMESISRVIREFGDDSLNPLTGISSREAGQGDADETLWLERRLWPAKVLGNGLKSFVLPIKPAWAKDLFDEQLAGTTLLGADPKLMLSWENVYYRSSRSAGGLTAPGRILWYVSSDKRYPGAGTIRACSVALEVVTLPAREAYSKFKRLGVYQRKDVIGTARGRPDDPVMAIRFADTETFKTPVTRESVWELLGKKPSFAGPYPLAEEVFAAIYRKGMSHDV